MSKNHIYSLILVFVLMGVFGLAIRVSKVGASGTIYIRANGLIEGTDKITSADNITYTFIDNIYDSIVVERDNITIDGAGYTLQRNGVGTDVGIELSGRRNVTVSNTTIHNFYFGIFSSEISPSNNISIVGNNFTNNGNGIDFVGSSNNSIVGNVFTQGGLLLVDSYGNLVENNLVNGKPLVYLEGVSNYVVQDAGQVILVNCNNIRIENLNVSNTNYAIQLGGTNNTIITNNHITANGVGILFFSARVPSNNNSIVGNNIANNTGYGMWLETFDNVSIVGNNITNNSRGMLIASAPHARNNRIFHNNFMNNTQQVVSTGDGTSVNSWDDGYPSGGNYWSDYNGTDLLKGPYKNLTGSDGVGDVPYEIPIVNGTGQTIGFEYANYSLMAAIGIFDVGTWNGVSYDVDVVSNSTVSNFHFNPEEGAFITFNVTGEDGTSGFCRVTIPKSLLWVEDGWTILVGGDPITDYTIIPDENYTYIYFTYNHSTQTVIIQGTHVVPEFPSGLILPLFMATTLIAAIFCRRKQKTKLKTV